MENIIELESLKKELKEAEKEIQAKKDLIENLEGNINKISFILGEWIEDYSFNEKPDPRKALQWTLENIDDAQCKKSAMWFWEYDRIHSLIEVAVDYTRFSRNLLDENK